MGLVFDLILLMASGAATVYCFVLSRRLTRLNDTKNGLGASIASMSQALDQTQQALTFARTSSIDAVQKLASSLEEAERVRPEIAKLIEELSALAELMVDDIDHAKDDALQQIDSRLANTRKLVVAPASVVAGKTAPQVSSRRVA